MKIEFKTSEDLRIAVRGLAEKSGMTQIEIGKRMGVSRQYVDFMLKNKVNFSLEDATRVLAALNYDFSYELLIEQKKEQIDD